MTAPIQAVEFSAELRQIKTMADGSVNVTLNLPEFCIPQTKIMLDWLGASVRIVAAVEDEKPEDKTGWDV